MIFVLNEFYLLLFINCLILDNSVVFLFFIFVNFVDVDFDEGEVFVVLI